MNYEICSLCELLRPSAEMQTVYVTDPTTRGQMPLRFCRSCLNPRLTYIQGPAGWFPQSQRLAIDVGRVLIYALALIVAVLNVIFGLVIGVGVGFGMALSGILLGAGILAAEAASQCGR